MKCPLVHSQWIIKSLMALAKLAHYSLNMGEERFTGGLPLAHCFCAIEYQGRMLSTDININAEQTAHCSHTIPPLTPHKPGWPSLVQFLQRHSLVNDEGSVHLQSLGNL